jgi:predicted small lipoprotein YifL
MCAVRSRRWWVGALCVALWVGLAGCGNKGPLTLPEPAQKPAPAGSSAPESR